MCQLNWGPEEWDYSPRPRPVPRLEWATPVDVVELGASVETYLNQLQQITALRLCHRFGNRSLSNLPQEILDSIISIAHELGKDTLRTRWAESYLCFQDRCTRSHHVNANDVLTTELWREIYADPWEETNGSPKDPAEYTNEEKAVMVKDYLDGDEYEIFDEGIDEAIWEVHHEQQLKWPERVCLCKDQETSQGGTLSFNRVNDVLRQHFGLQAIILHEALPSALRSFLPDNSGYSDYSYRTPCFLTLASSKRLGQSDRARIASDRNIAFLESDNHLAFQQVVHPDQMVITEQQRARYARALRVLGLQPHYDISELDALLTADNKDDAFWAICHRQIANCPKPTEEPKSVKNKLLQQYLQAKNQGIWKHSICKCTSINFVFAEISKQPWPKLMILASSDVVGPSQ